MRAEWHFLCTVIISRSNNQGIQLVDLNGFVVQDCVIEEYDSGIIANDAKATLQNILISGCQSFGITLSTRSELAISNCQILNGRSGALRVDSQCIANLMSCEIRNNTRSNGSAIFLNSSASTNLSQCLIENNQATNGAVIAASNSNLELNDTEFINNNAVGQFGMIFLTNSTANISKSILQNNSTTSKGGVLHLRNSTASITNSLLADNSAGDNGGAIYNEFSECELINCTLADNVSSGVGGAIYTGNLSPVNMVNCIVANNNNTALYELDFFSEFGLRNCLFFGNDEGDLRDHDTNLTYTGAADINSLAGGSFLEGNLDGNPRFVNPEIDDYRLMFSSPAIDNGSAIDAPSSDLLGNFRPYRIFASPNSGYDIGAFEFLLENTQSENWGKWH